MVNEVSQRWTGQLTLKSHRADVTYYSGVFSQLFQRGEVVVLLPGEALLTVSPSLIHCQHVGVSRTSEHQLPHREVSHRPQASASVRTQEPLRALYTFVLHGAFLCFRIFYQTQPTTTCVCWVALISFSLSPVFLCGPLCVRCCSQCPLLETTGDACYLRNTVCDCEFKITLKAIQKKNQ